MLNRRLQMSDDDDAAVKAKAPTTMWVGARLSNFNVTPAKGLARNMEAKISELLLFDEVAFLASGPIP